MSRETWIQEVNRELFAVYGITLDDAGVDDDFIDRCLDMTPDEFVDWYGEKYDLTPRGQYPW